MIGGAAFAVLSVVAAFAVSPLMLIACPGREECLGGFVGGNISSTRRREMVISTPVSQPG